MPAPPFPPPPPSIAAGLPGAGAWPPNTPHVATSAEYGQWARNQHPFGNVYGGPGSIGAGQLTTAFPAGSPLEHSGSLTGHILAEGQIDGPARSSRTTNVIAVMLLVVAALIAVGLLAAATVGDTMSRLFDVLVNG